MLPYVGVNMKEVSMRGKVNRDLGLREALLTLLILTNSFWFLSFLNASACRILNKVRKRVNKFIVRMTNQHWHNQCIDQYDCTSYTLMSVSLVFLSKLYHTYFGYNYNRLAPKLTHRSGTFTLQVLVIRHLTKALTPVLIYQNEILCTRQYK